MVLIFFMSLLFFMFILEVSSIRLLISYSLFTWLTSILFLINMDSFKYLIPLWLILSTGLFVIFAYIVSLEESMKSKKVYFLKAFFLSILFLMFFKKLLMNNKFYLNKFYVDYGKDQFYGFFEENIYMIYNMTVWLMILIFLVILFLSLLGSKGRGLRKLSF